MFLQGLVVKFQLKAEPAASNFLISACEAVPRMSDVQNGQALWKGW